MLQKMQKKSELLLLKNTKCGFENRYTDLIINQKKFFMSTLALDSSIIDINKEAFYFLY